jgi:hypothetical protein
MGNDKCKMENQKWRVRMPTALTPANPRSGFSNLLGVGFYPTRLCQAMPIGEVGLGVFNLG